MYYVLHAHMNLMFSWEQKRRKLKKVFILLESYGEDIFVASTFSPLQMKKYVSSPIYCTLAEMRRHFVQYSPMRNRCMSPLMQINF